MQAQPAEGVAALLDHLVAAALPDGPGLGAWRAFLQAHATLLRELEARLVAETGTGLGDFDVLAQLALAGGELRMTELAARAFVSRSAMTRRVDRLVGQGLVRRSATDGDARAVVVQLTDSGVARLQETVPAHLRSVAELFASPLDEEELMVLERALRKVTVDCTFG